MATLSLSDRVRVGLLLVLLVLPSRAHAEEPAAPEPSRDEYARELYLRGERAYQEGDYEQAISALTRAYEFSQRPALLYDLANAYERLGRHAEAASQLERYVADAPERQRETVRKRIASLQARAADQGRRDSAATQRLTPSLPESAEPASQKVLPSRTETARPEARSPLGYIVAGAGMASIGVGVFFGIAARSARGDARELCVPSGESVLCPVRTRMLLERASHRALAANITWASGLAAVAAGLYLVLGRDGDGVQSSAIRVTPLARGAELDVVHAF